ncbi:hypothetical protein OG754_10915 [Streptomyces decoyicus]|uniref:hypothetical protein n=1 Tax=Streptomyces decoyicus TaxID=249567 RepID=UPI002E2EF152|nr:hypothetical protein [Streptomyces decoyicus]
MAEGYDAVPAVERERLLRYLESVVAARRTPVHAAVAFNAVYFGYDLDGDGYGRSPLRLDDFPVVSLGERVPALPVGAMVCVATGADPLYAEILYKEGAHPDVGTFGDVPAWVSLHAWVFTLTHDEHLVLLLAHHIVSDGACTRTDADRGNGSPLRLRDQ